MKTLKVYGGSSFANNGKPARTIVGAYSKKQASELLGISYYFLKVGGVKQEII